LTDLPRRFLPNEIFAVAEIPRTLSGKTQQLPIKKLLLGQSRSSPTRRRWPILDASTGTLHSHATISPELRRKGRGVSGI